MIRIERGEPPAGLDGDEKTQAELKRAQAFFARPESNRQQERFEFRQVLPDDVVAHLRVVFHHKCAFCECVLAEHHNQNVHRLRPRHGAIGRDGAFSAAHYWWLAFAWSNLYLSCPYCTMNKGARFPVAGKRAERSGGQRALDAEKVLLVDPCADDPAEHLVFGEEGKVAGCTARGEATVEVFGLNRSYLVEQRRAHAWMLRQAWQALVSGVGPKGVGPKQVVAVASLSVQPGLPFLQLHRQLVAHWAAEAQVPPDLLERLGISRERSAQPGGRKQVIARFVKAQRAKEGFSLEAADAPAPGGAAPVAGGQVKQAYMSRAWLIDRIEIENFKGIERLSLQFPSADPRRAAWLMLLGENGVGKSSILQAVALAMMPASIRDKLGLDPREILRQGSSKGRVTVHLTGTDLPLEITFDKRSARFRGERANKAFLFGYGATRLLPRGKKTATIDSSARVENLFDPFHPLSDPRRWLLGLPEAQFQNAAHVLKKLLSLPAGDKVRRDKRRRKVWVDSHGFRAGLDQLSDGYQSVIALAAELTMILQRYWEDMTVAEGVLLLDEIDAHLHPRWRMRIVGALRSAFPRMQVLATTHDPLCLRGLSDGEVVILRRDAKARVMSVARDEVPPIAGLRVDQILLSEHFGLSSTMDPEIEEKFERYYALLASPPRTRAENTEVEALRRELESARLLGANRRERLMLEAIDEHLAAHGNAAAPAERAASEAAAKRRIIEIWESTTPSGSPEASSS
jgi:uncharacterized protein (TIGR02646 family)